MLEIHLVKVVCKSGEQKSLEDIYSLTEEGDGSVGGPKVTRSANLESRDVSYLLP